MILVIPDKKIRSWPKHTNAKKWPCQAVGVAFATEYSTDAHFAAYSAPEHPYRLSSDAFSEIAGGVRMVLAVFDVDAPGHGTAAGATDEWWAAELEKIAKLRAAHPGCFVYRTRGGYRIVFAVDVTIRDSADRAAWKLRYCTWVAYLARVFDIVADPACKDATRLYRLPFVRRDGHDERRETIGGASELGSWECSPAPEDERVAAKLERVRGKKPSAKREERPAAVIGEGILFHAFRARGDIGPDLGRSYALRCAWSSEHTSGVDFDSSTVLFAPSAGEAFGWPHCSHSHCQGRDLRDWLRTFTAEELDAAREAAGVAKWEPAPTSTATNDVDMRDVPTITIGTDERRVSDEAVAALANLPGLYQRGGHLADVVEVDGRRIIRDLVQPSVREQLSLAARWVELRSDKETGELVEVPAHVPEWSTRAVMSRGVWPGIPALRGVIGEPALRPDGSIIQAAGYDAATGYLYLPATTYPAVPDAPARVDAKAAARDLLDVVRDFPFASDVHRAAWLAFTLTFFARPAYTGPTPLVAIDANVRGGGKGKLADATVMIATGRAASKTPQPNDDDELRKRITAVLREGERAECIDNVTRPIADGSLDALLTSDVWKDRKLGTNETIALPNLAVWIVTGNNLEFGADTARRTLHIRLESPLENPEDRNDLTHPDLLGWVEQQRPRLVVAALTILRSYFVHGRQDMGVRPWGSFEAWSRLVASAVIWAGLPDPQTTRVELEATSDTRKGALVALLEGWARLTSKVPDGITSRDAIGALYPSERLRGGMTYDDGHNTLREAIESLVPTPSGKAPNAAKLSYQLRHFRGRVVGGRSLDGAEGRDHAMRWRVIVAKPATSNKPSARDARDESDVLDSPTCEKPKKPICDSEPSPGLKHPSHASHPSQSDFEAVAE